MLKKFFRYGSQKIDLVSDGILHTNQNSEWLTK